MSKLDLDYQNKYIDHLIFDENILDSIDPNVKLHNEARGNPLSSAASCLNVLGSLRNKPNELKKFLNHFGLDIEKIYEFPKGANVGGLIYNDSGYVIFEWIGPKKSPINEKGGSRGQNRTSVDAYVIAKIENKVTQLLIEWKFTEGRSRSITLQRFGGKRGLERLKRYSQILLRFRKNDEFPFNFSEENGIGLYDFSPDHLYQLMRITLLAKMTTPIEINGITIQDYRVVHLSHSQNNKINTLSKNYLEFSPGLKKYANNNLHTAWKNILSTFEQNKFIGGYWDEGIKVIGNGKLKDYLENRY